MNPLKTLGSVCATDGQPVAVVDEMAATVVDGSVRLPLPTPPAATAAAAAATFQNSLVTVAVPTVLQPTPAVVCTGPL